MSRPGDQIHVVHAAYRAQQQATRVAIQQMLRNSTATNEAPQVLRLPPILLQIVLELGDRTDEGQYVRAVAAPWFEIIRLMLRDERLIHELDPRKWEELVAGAWEREGYAVILTPRSGDGGRDVIATLSHGTRVRLIDQVKRYRPDRRVTAHDVRAMIGTLTLDPLATRGVITTTSEFAPGIAKDPAIQRLIPERLVLRPREPLLVWLDKLANEPPQG
jgi:restriction system protein